ncbi:O-methyltransferase [Marinobacter sp. JSM 1782161]|uniref:O-methyltransferase n=1 Tax=Marinobacter sp. JSM 1782161 TaxID=2685906 RepID=UPI0014038180|nr:DUF1442 domain-containing protein [Marinobacter sp. JSM 1782161]
MDTQVQAVIDHYHDLIRQERDKPRDPERQDRAHRFMAVGPETGQLLNTLVRGLDRPRILELGTSMGYSGIWLADAARASGGRVITMEQEAHKSEFAREMATKAGLADFIDFRVGDAIAMIDELDEGIDFVLLDLWKDLYVPCLEAFYPKLNPGAMIVADNMIRPGGENVQAYGRAVRAKEDMTSVLLPVGTGLELSRFRDQKHSDGAS